MARADSTPPSPTRWVTDSAALLSETTRAALDAQLEAYQRSTGHELLVWIAASSEGVAAEEFAVRAFEAWGVGRKGLDDGLVLFIFARDHRMRIEVGYGLESIVTDAQASRIVNDTLAPQLRSGDANAAVTSAVDRLIKLIGKNPKVALRDDQIAPQPMSVGQMIIYGILALIFLAFLITHPRMALFLIASIASRGRGGGGGGGGSNRGGGGGRSGGGGAGGSW